MIANKNFINIISLYLFISSTWTMTMETSETMRPTDIIFEKTNADDNPEIKYQDYQMKEKDVRIASIPDKLYLNMPVMASCMVPNPTDPKQLVFVKNLNQKLDLPGGYLNYAEDPSVGAARKFSEKVIFEMDNGSKKHPGLIGGFFGRPSLEVMQKKSTPYGPFMGVFGVGNRATKRPNIKFVYNFIMGQEYVKPVLGNEASLDAMFCDVINILARNLETITDDVEHHPLKPLADKLEEEDVQTLYEANQGSETEKTLEELNKCQQNFQDDTFNILNLYYLNLIKFKIIEANGDMKPNAQSILWNKTDILNRKKSDF